jgi:hypothetical protein
MAYGLQLYNVGGAEENHKKKKTKKKRATATRFELARAEPSRFLIYLLNHSDTLSGSRQKGGDARIELATSCTRSRNHTTRPITLRPERHELLHGQEGTSKFKTETKKTGATATRFELARAEPSRFRICLLNHSDTLPPSFEQILGDWSSGMIPALGAGGREFDSRITPFLFLCDRLVEGNELPRSLVG